MAWRDAVDELRQDRDDRWRRTRLAMARARLLAVHRRFLATATRAVEDAAKMVAEQTEDLQAEFLQAHAELLEAAEAAGQVVRMEWSKDGELSIELYHPRPWVRDHRIGGTCHVR